jgi:hypothetical protein
MKVKTHVTSQYRADGRTVFRRTNSKTRARPTKTADSICIGTA